MARTKTHKKKHYHKKKRGGAVARNFMSKQRNVAIETRHADKYHAAQRAAMAAMAAMGMPHGGGVFSAAGLRHRRRRRHK